MNLTLTGSALTVEQLHAVAHTAASDAPDSAPVTDNPASVDLDAEGIARINHSRQIVLTALERGDTVYGLTTGLGSQVSQMLSKESLQAFSYQTIRGRAHAIGKPLSIPIVRGAMLVRLNTLLKGGAGSDIAIANGVRDCLNAGLTPVVGEVGSIGASDLCWGATMGLALIGEGRMYSPDGEVMAADIALQQAALSPIKLGPKDGLVLANHSSFSAAMMALNVFAAKTLYDAVQSSAAISMEAFVANTTPLNPLATTMRPQRGQSEAAEQLLALLQGSAIIDYRNARRLQDPLSIRNVVQVHGALLATIDFCHQIANDEINGASDNPVVDIEKESLISCGAYHTPLLAIAAQALSAALVQTTHTILARITKLLTARFTDLPQYLAAPGAHSNGFAPLLKVAEALVAEITQGAAPTPVWPSVNADGAEDIQTHSPTAIKALARVIDLSRQLCAIEFIVASQAFDLRALGQPAPKVCALVRWVRSHAPPLRQDRPLNDDIESLAHAIRRGEATALIYSGKETNCL